MRENGSDLRRLADEIGVSTMELAVAADLHPQTLYRVYNGDKVARSTLNRIRNALSQLQERLNSKSKVAG